MASIPALHNLKRSYRRHRRIAGALAGVFVAVFPVTAALSTPAPAGASSEYANAAIADKALSYVGRWGGKACSESRKPGDRGGQCRAFVNCIVWMTSGGKQNIGGSYFNGFLKAGGTEIKRLDDLQKGDIVQEGYGRHTFIIVSRVSGNTFNIVDSNHRWDERVRNYNREVTLSFGKRAFRMGSVAPHMQLAASQPAQPAAAPVMPMMGALEAVEPAEGGAVVRGWAIDGDVTRPVQVRTYAGAETSKPEDGETQTVRADRPRLDIATKYGKYGSQHGFHTFIALKKGNHVICVYGVNAPATAGEDIKLGCRAVTVQ